MSRLAMLLVATPFLSCAHGGSMRRIPTTSPLPTECGPVESIARPELVLTHDERATLALLDGSCRAAVQARDEALSGGCAPLVPTIAGWRREVVAELVDVANARERGDVVLATELSRRVERLREAAEARGLDACAGRAVDAG